VRYVVREMGALTLGEQAELGRLCRRLGLAPRGERSRKETDYGVTAHPLRVARAL